MFFFETRQDKSVDRIPNPRCVFNGQWIHSLEWLKSPPIRAFWSRCGGLVFGPQRSQLNPATDARDLIRLELSAGRHFQLARLLDGPHEQALRRISGLDRSEERR